MTREGYPARAAAGLARCLWKNANTLFHPLRDRALGVELLIVVYDHVAAPAVDGRAETRMSAGGQIAVAPAGAEADHADLAVRIGLRPQKRHASLDVTHH